MTEEIAADTEPTDLRMALIELRQLRAEVAHLRPFVAVADGASRAAEHWEQAAGEIGKLYAAAENQRDDARAERDGAYRERAYLVALLAAMTEGAVIVPALDLDEPGWWIAYLTIGDRQASWHISPRDLELFTHFERVEPDDPRAQWNGHTTGEKYDCIVLWTAELMRQRPKWLPNVEDSDG